MKYRCQLTKGDGTTVLAEVDGIAPNMGLASNLYQSAEFKINESIVSRISDHMPEIDAYQTRLNKSASYLEGIGSSTNWWQTSQSIRQAQVSGGGELIQN